MARAPEVTVVMPVFNAAPYLAAAVGSVLAQSFTDFELLALDDGSSDGSLEMLRRFDDPRLRVVARRHEGVVRTMNAGLELATGAIIARADADDVYVPRRLECQLEVLRRRPAVGLVGAGAVRLGQRLVSPPDSTRIRWTALYRNPVANTTIVFRKAAAEAVGGYPDEHLHLDDYPFVSCLVDRYDAVNLRQPVVTIGVHDGSISTSFSREALAEGDVVRRANLRRLVGDTALVDRLFYFLAGGPRPAALVDHAVTSDLGTLLAAFESRYGALPRAARRWIGRQLFEQALQHGETAPGVLLAMTRAAIRLNPALALDPRTGKALVRHLLVARRQPAAPHPS